MSEGREPLRSRGLRRARLRAYRFLLSQRAIYRALRAAVSPNLLLATSDEPRAGERFADFGVRATVLAYFADSPARAYQIRQWLPVFEKLHERHPILVLTRSLDSFTLLQRTTDLPLAFTRRLRDLEDALETTQAKVCLYVNNSTLNFQPLSWRRSLHVHLNHGESDKISMASNQAKAYDTVFVAGEAAERRYRDNLIDFGGDRLVRVGRPQLDIEFPRVLEPASRPSLMYAPTWEGDTPAMNYTSLAKYGLSLVERLLLHGAFRIVYKPHPRVVRGSPEVTGAHEAIVRALTDENATLPAPDQHVVAIEENILSLFSSCDILACDVSSVALDWLYLRTAAPLWIFDPYEDRERLVSASPLAASVGVVDAIVMDDVAGTLHASLADDPHRASREEARRFYFGELEPGESTRRFLEAVDELVSRRDALLAAKRADADGVEVGAGVV
jgi:CDP-Glycerol:Poly(glycerophosphate) glycerophosphotransferase